MSQPKVIYSSFTTITGPDKCNENFFEIIKHCIKFSMCIELKKKTIKSITFISYHINKSFFERFLYKIYDISGKDNLIMWFTNERTIFTKKFNGEFFVQNYIDFLYCFMTNRFEPESPKTKNDIVTMMLCRVIAGIIKSIEFLSLKSMGLSRAGYTPMSMITNDSSILNISKFSNIGNKKKEFSVYTPSESMFLNTPITRDETIFISNIK